MTTNRQDGLYLLLLGFAILVVVGSAMKIMARDSMGGDFRGVFNATRCVLQGRDPYRVNIAAGVEKASLGPGAPSRNEPLFINPPFSIAIFLPFAVFPWGPAQILWTVFFTGCILLAALLIWECGAQYAPRISGALICILLANCVVVFHNGNPAGVAVGTCVIGAWCIMNERFVPAGVLCLAISLAIKPHDSGLVWLCFLLRGGILRKRAMQVLAVVALMSIPSFVWVWHVAPHWIPEMLSNIAEMGTHGGLTDPGPTGAFNLSIQPIIDLQAAVSYIHDDPSVYNPVTYAICGVLVMIWALATFKSDASRENLWFSIAIAAAMSMLVTYHRPYDAKLLILTVPACAILWSEGRIERWIAIGVSTCGVIFTAEIPLAVVGSLAQKLSSGGGGLVEKLATVVITRPASPILLATAIFYLWAYVKRIRTPETLVHRAGHLDAAVHCERNSEDLRSV